ncbi:MAG: glycosyltransferase [Acidobacteria bacterium]|nr:glycosyltransferase [Acidobacteriota bacterium]
MSRTLYICYFGVREPLVQTQVLPYLRELGKGIFTAETRSRGEEVIATTPSAEAAATPPYQGGEPDAGTEGGEAFVPIEVSLLTFEPSRAAADLEEFERIRAELRAKGIEWDWLPYHKRPSAVATAWDIFRGAYYIWRRIGRFDVLHGRVHVPTLMGALARKFSLRKPKLLFDIRGFMPEEYTDAGIWPEGGLLYRGAKRVERWLMKESDAFVVLTEKAREILFPESKETGYDKHGRPVEVIPCCVDLEKRFAGDREVLRQVYSEKLGIGGRKVFVHIGALGGLYLTREMAEVLAAFREKNPSVFALFLTQSDPMLIENELQARGFGASDYFVGRARPDEIEGYLSASDVGLSFVKATFATASRSPTKIPEYLACGLPLIANSGVGDVDLLIEGHGVGALIEEFNLKSYLRAFDRVESLGNISAKCREVAGDEFDLKTVGGARYRRLYVSLTDIDGK